MKTLIFSLIMILGLQVFAQGEKSNYNNDLNMLNKTEGNQTEGSVIAPGHQTCADCKAHEAAPATLNNVDQPANAGGVSVTGQTGTAGSQKRNTGGR